MDPSGSDKDQKLLHLSIQMLILLRAVCISTSRRDIRVKRGEKNHQIAKMQWSLFLLILMGHWSFFTCQLYEYHFIRENKTWCEAQTYCREKYTDLATVFDMTDMKRLRDSTKNQNEAWIGLHKELNVNKTWHWSLPGVEFSHSETEWDTNEPNDHNGHENCVRMDKCKWKDVLCTHTYKFICYNGKQQSNKAFHLINNETTWPQAQRYCRQHHTDLVSGLSQLKDEEFENEMKSKNKLWIGLFRDTWRWSDRSKSSFRNWDLESKYEEGKKNCAMTVSDGLKWGSDDCSKDKPFFCYDDKVILIKEKKTWAEALNYCRRNHYDLVSITDLHQQRWVQERAKNADTGFVWLGLRYTCTLDLWFWVNDEVVCYENWASDGSHDSCATAAVMKKGGKHKWHKKDDTEKFNFICALQ